MLYARGYIPVHHPSGGEDNSVAWAHSPAEALACNYSWNECAIQFATMVGQTISLCGVPLVPSHVRRARVCSLYRQGAGSCVFGWSHRPSYPEQQRVGNLIQKEFKSHIRPTAYGWWPGLELDSMPDLCRFHWSPPGATWDVLQKRLKAGTPSPFVNLHRHRLLLSVLHDSSRLLSVSDTQPLPLPVGVPSASKMPLLVGWRPSLLGWRPLLRPLLLVGGPCY